jgi:hypothetical protein
MDTTVEILQFVIVVSAAILAGGQLFCLLAVLPAMRYDGWDLGFSVKVHQDALTVRPHRYLRVTGAFPIFGAIAVLAIEGSLDLPMVLTIVGLALSVVNAVVSSREWPINDEINSWRSNPGPAAERYPVLRRKWDVQHLIRTIASLLSLAFFSAAVILY